jgi:hypothetical protein
MLTSVIDDRTAQHYGVESLHLLGHRVKTVMLI